MPGIRRGEEVAMPGVKRGEEAAIPGVRRGEEAAMPGVKSGEEATMHLEILQEQGGNRPGFECNRLCGD